MPQSKLPSFRGLDPVVDDLWDLAHHEDGLAAAALAPVEALLTVPAIRRRLDPSRPNPPVAIAGALDDLGESEFVTLSIQQYVAIRVLLAMEHRPVVNNKTRSIPPGAEPLTRAEIAAELIYGRRDDRSGAWSAPSGEWFRRARPQEGKPVSPEWRLFSHLRSDLERLEPAQSLTRGLVWTPTQGAGLGADAADLAGTWRGTVWSPNMLRVLPSPARPERVDGYLVVRPGADGFFDLVNYVEHGTSVMVAQRVVTVGGQRRLIAIYEAQTRVGAEPAQPTHRGAMFLLVEGAPATRLDGPYWTDRLTYGRLTFVQRREEFATSYHEAAALWPS